jgi:hypothetical protein
VTRARRRVLVLYWHPWGGELRAAIRHHLEALEQRKGTVQTLYVNTFGGVPRGLRHVSFDAIVLHTTFLCMRWSHLFYTWKWGWRWLREFDGPKIALPQDEYDHSEILDEWLFELGVTDVFTNFGAPSRELLYPLMSQKAEFHKCFTGYIDDAAARQCGRLLRPIAARDLDIVYRAFRLPFWFGRQGQLKHLVGTVVAERAGKRDRKVDISTRPEDTVTGKEWFDFLMSGKVVIGCESGSSVLDRRGEIRARIQNLLKDSPQLSFEDVTKKMPEGWDDHRFFALSPRHFEAIITKTCQVLVEGEYEGVLVPGRHYIPLKRDFSNVDEVIDLTALLQRIADCAYQEIYERGQYSYRTLAQSIEEAIIRPARAGGVGARHIRTPFWRIAKIAIPAQLRAAEAMATIWGMWLSGWWSRLRTAPLAAASKGALAMRLALSDPPLRRLLLAYVRDRRARNSIRLAHLMDDLLRLGIARQVAAGRRRSFATEAHYDSAEGTWVLRSMPIGHRASGQSCSGARGRLTEIEWDHSAVDCSLRWVQRRELVIRMGSDGTYRFGALAQLANRHADRVWDALSALGGPPVAPPE